MKAAEPTKRFCVEYESLVTGAKTRGRLPYKHRSSAEDQARQLQFIADKVKRPVRIRAVEI